MLHPRLRLYYIFVIVFVVMHVAGRMAEPLAYIYNALITFSVVMLVLVSLDRWHSKNTTEEAIKNLGYKTAPLTDIAPALVVSIALLLLYPLLAFAFKIPLALNESWLPNTLGIILTGGLMEETFFRGFLFRHLRHEMSFKKAVGISTLLFTAAHLLLFAYQHWSIALLSTILAVASAAPLAYLFERGSNTVWGPALVHATIRTVGMVVTTNTENFMQLSLFWISGCMLLPWLVLLPYPNFRKKIFGTQESNSEVATKK